MLCSRLRIRGGAAQVVKRRLSKNPAEYIKNVKMYAKEVNKEPAKLENRKRAVF